MYHNNWKKWETDVSEKSREALDNLDGFAPTARCDTLKSGNDNGYLDYFECFILAKAFLEAGNFLIDNNSSEYKRVVIIDGKTCIN